MSMGSLSAAVWHTLFLNAMGVPTGDSIVERDKLELASELLKKAVDRKLDIYLPEDHVIGRELNPSTESRIVGRAEIPDGWRGLDIGPKSVEAFGTIVSMKQRLSSGMALWVFTNLKNLRMEQSKLPNDSLSPTRSASSVGEIVSPQCIKPASRTG